MTRKIYTLIAIVSIPFAAALSSCGDKNVEGNGTAGDSTAVANDSSHKASEPREGDICSVVNDSTGKSFGVVKVLKIENDTYHIRTYGVSFDKRPQDIDVKDLKATPAGIGHLPIAKKDFLGWNPEVIVQQTVTEEELEGYKLWKNGQK
jgi:hypothetical protein